MKFDYEPTMYQELTDRLTSGVVRCITEEEVRFLWLSELKNTLGVEFQAERERNDAYYNGIIIEFKKVDEEDNETPEQTLERAIAQIEEKKYAAELEAAGIRKILKIAVAFQGKELWMRHVV